MMQLYTTTTPKRNPVDVLSENILLFDCLVFMAFYHTCGIYNLSCSFTYENTISSSRYISLRSKWHNHASVKVGELVNRGSIRL